MPMIDQPSTPDARNYNSLLISPYKPNLFQREEPFLPPGFSPARSVASRGEEPNIFGFGLNSRVFSPFKSELKSRENNCHTNYLRSGFKNCADFQDDENIFEGYPYDPEQDSLSLMFNGGSAIKFKQENELAEESKAGRNLQEDFDNSDLEGNFSSNIDTFPERGSSKILNNLDQFLARKNNSERSLTAFSEIRHTESTQDTRFPNISRPSVPINIFDPSKILFKTI